MSNKQKELSLTFKNWDIDDIILELSHYIKSGYHVCSYCHDMSFHDGWEVKVELIEAYRG